MSNVWQVGYLVVFCFWLLLIARLVCDYAMQLSREWRPGRASAVGLEVVYSTTDPPLRALRRLIPPRRFGSISLDLGFMVLAIIVFLLVLVLRGLASS